MGVLFESISAEDWGGWVGVPEVLLPHHDLPLLRLPDGLALHKVHPTLQSSGQTRVICTII